MFNLTVGVKLEVEDYLFILTPTDVPLLGTYNGTSNLPPSAGNNATLPVDDVFETKVEWLEETLLTPRSTVGATCVTADTYITVATGDQNRFSTGDVILVDSEYARVTGYGTTTDTLTITRAYSGSAAQHVPAVQVIGIGRALPEGSDPNAARFKDRTDVFNYTQIFGPEAITISGTRQAVSQKGGLYGVNDEFNKQASNRLREQMVALEQAILYGTRVNDTTNDWRTMGGLPYYITSNVDTTSTAFTYTALMTQWQNSYDNGGMIDTLLMGSTQKRNASFLDESSIRLARADRIRGQVVDVIQSDFGEANVVLDRWVRKNNIFAIDKQWITLCTLRPMTLEVLAKTGDSLRGEIVGEKSLKVRMQARHAMFTALT